MEIVVITFLAASMWCFGFHVVMIKVVWLEVLGNDIFDSWDTAPRWFKVTVKPLVACPYCMSSVHGTIIYFLFIHQGLIYWPIFCVCLCGFNYLLSQIINE